MSPFRYFVVGAFTDRPFAGNPAAVVPLSAWTDDGWLQDVAMEMSLSESAFLVKEGDGYPSIVAGRTDTWQRYDEYLTQLKHEPSGPAMKTAKLHRNTKRPGHP
jgi:hypothetical protein